MHKRITMKLSAKSIGAAIREVEALQAKESGIRSERLKSIAEAVRDRAQEYYDAAWVDDIVGGTRRAPEVSVTVQQTGRGYKVVASGADAVFVEFGAGVYHNTPTGTSPHPKGAELGFTIGSYGKGHGKGRAWGYYGEDGELVITHGTPAQMPLYRALRDICDEVKGNA